MFNTDSDIHSLLLICSRCEDMWEAGGEYFTALPEPTGLNGQMDAITCLGFVFSPAQECEWVIEESWI